MSPRRPRGNRNDVKHAVKKMSCEPRALLCLVRVQKAHIDFEAAKEDGFFSIYVVMFFLYLSAAINTCYTCVFF